MAEERLSNNAKIYVNKHAFPIIYRYFKRTEIEIPSDNKYLIFQIRRFIYIDKNKVFLENSIEIDNKIIVSKVNYKLIGTVIYTGDGRMGHYIYITFCNGDIYYVYNDDNVITKDEDKNYYRSMLNKNAYLILYERI